MPAGMSPYLLPLAPSPDCLAPQRHARGLVKSSPASLDVAAKPLRRQILPPRREHELPASVEATFAVSGMTVTGSRILEIAPENPRQEISPLNPTFSAPSRDFSPIPML